MSLVYSHHDTIWGKVFVKSNPETQFTIENKTGLIFNSDGRELIRFKCALLIVGSPLAALVRVVYNIAHTLFLLITLPIQLIQRSISKSSAQNILFEKITDIVRPIIYGTAMTGCALYGLIDPYRARSSYGYLERILNRQETEIHTSKKTYLAICFQPLYLPSSRDIAEERLTKYLNKE